MKIIDTPLPALAGRTVREALLIAGGLVICWMELDRPGTNYWHLGVFASGTALFAVRFFAARVVAIGVLLSAIAAHVASIRWYGEWHTEHLFWGVYAMAAGVLLLCSGDLARRFDYAPSGPGWRLNRWRELPRSHWRAATFLGWSLGILGHFLLRGWQASGQSSDWPLWAIVGCIAGVLLLFTGRSIVFVLSAVIGIAVVIAVVPHVGAAEGWVDGVWQPPGAAGMWEYAPESALPAAAAALATALVSLPYAALHLWRSLLVR